MKIFIIAAAITLVVIIAAVVVLVVTITYYNGSSYYQMTGNSYFSTVYDKGRIGEYQIYRSLSFLEKEGARFLFNVYLPKGNGQTTECDVILIAPKGIIVFESKNYGGWIFGDENQKMWTQTLSLGRGRQAQKERFYNPIMQNKQHVNYLYKVTNGRFPIYSIVVFSDRCELKSVKVYSNNVRVIRLRQIYEAVANIFNYAAPCITPQQIEELYNSLYPFTQVSNEVKMQHIQNIKNNYK